MPSPSSRSGRHVADRPLSLDGASLGGSAIRAAAGRERRHTAGAAAAAAAVVSGCATSCLAVHGVPCRTGLRHPGMHIPSATPSRVRSTRRHRTFIRAPWLSVRVRAASTSIVREVGFRAMPRSLWSCWWWVRKTVCSVNRPRRTCSQLLSDLGVSPEIALAWSTASVASSI